MSELTLTDEEWKDILKMTPQILLLTIALFATPFLFDNFFSFLEKNEIIMKKYENAVNEYEILVNRHNNLVKEYRKLTELKNVSITAYSTSISETDNTPNKTAIMERPIPGYTCAVSKDLSYLLGCKIYIENLGVFKVNDLMNKRFSKRIDLCKGREDAIKFGKKSKDIVVIK